MQSLLDALRALLNGEIHGVRFVNGDLASIAFYLFMYSPLIVVIGALAIWGKCMKTAAVFFFYCLLYLGAIAMFAGSIGPAVPM